VIDLGPEGGDGGGEIVAWGPPEDIVKAPRSYTGRFLMPVLKKAGKPRKSGASEAAE
jgi:excinuclease ABC subunit A